MMQLLSILVVAMGIGMLIFIHEAGHYVCARLIGVRVQVFSLGFGPRLLGFRRGDTDYRLSAVPLGGYVRVAGEDYVQREHLPSDHLHAKGLAARTLFFSGGVVMNLLFGVVAFILVFHSGVQFIAPEVGRVAPGGAAWEAGLEPGDRILTVDGKEMYSWPNLVTEVALAGSAARLSYERGDQVLTAVVRPRYAEGAGMPFLGIGQPVDPKAPAVEVVADGPAAQAGLQNGDRLIAIDGRSLDATGVAAALAAAQREPREVEIGFLRDGEPRTLRVRPQPSSSSPLGPVLVSQMMPPWMLGPARSEAISSTRASASGAPPGRTRRAVHRRPGSRAICSGSSALSSRVPEGTKTR